MNVRYVIVVLVALGVGVAAYVARPVDITLRSVPPAAWSEKTVFWEEEIEARGAGAAYAALAQYVSQLSYAKQHEEAHAFGAALFETEGEDGIAVCDDRFSFGCFHQFLGDAIHSLGLESVPTLNARCFEALEKSPLSCQHGIGHGILAALGYEDDAMRKALDSCAALPGTDPIGGCYGGVFMEYNVRTMLADAATPREFTGNAFAPCDSLEGDFVPACIYWQPQWWQQTVLAHASVREQFAAMGAYCRDFVQTPALERACFEGVGNVVAQSSRFDAREASELCKSVSTEEKQQLLCLSIAANHFGIDVSAEAAEQVCSVVTGRAHEYCIGYARNQLNIANVGALPL